MTDKEIIKALECCFSDEAMICEKCPLNEERRGDVFYLLELALDLINRQQEQLEATIAGQDTLQKALAEKDREAAELNSNLKLLKNNYNHLKTNFDETIEKNKRLRDKVVGLTAENYQLIKTFGECQERAIKDFAKAVIDGIDEGYISHSSDIVDFTNDYLREEGYMND